MARLLFIDESGQDQNQSPFEVLAGVAIEDKQLWPLIQAIHELEVQHFGQRYAAMKREMKAKKLLKRKTFRHAAQLDPIDPDLRAALAKGCLADGPSASREEITALAQAKIAFCLAVLEATREAGGVVLATMIPKSAPRFEGDFLRKDYAFIFERYFYLLSQRADYRRSGGGFGRLHDRLGCPFDRPGRAGTTRDGRAVTTHPQPSLRHSPRSAWSPALSYLRNSPDQRPAPR